MRQGSTFFKMGIFSQNINITLIFLFLSVWVTCGFKHSGVNTAYKVDAKWAGTYPFQDPSLPWAQRVDDLIGRLTLDELVNQTVTLYGIPTYGVPRLGIKPYVWIAECLRGELNRAGTAFPQALGLAATFR